MEPQLTREDDGQQGTLSLVAPDGSALASLHYVWRDAQMIIDHTFVPPHLRGKGHAEKIVHAAVKLARDDGFRIAPQCSYVVKLFALWGTKVDDVRA